ncbi:MAG TPA: hypothetical protein DEF47_24280 [Herpetosiphon sp.]|nr:hypothetical protein [Herpetosiphon sp.]
MSFVEPRLPMARSIVLNVARGSPPQVNQPKCWAARFSVRSPYQAAAIMMIRRMRHGGAARNR